MIQAGERLGAPGHGLELRLRRGREMLAQDRPQRIAQVGVNEVEEVGDVARLWQDRLGKRLGAEARIDCELAGLRARALAGVAELG